MSDTLKKVAICCPCGEKAFHSFAEQIGHVQKGLQQLGVENIFYRIPGCSMLELARSSLAGYGMRSGADVLFWVDDDMTYKPEDAIRLCQEAFAHQTLVGAVASQRTVRGKMNIKLAHDPPYSMTMFDGGGLVEVVVVGFGMVAVSREVFARVGESLPDVHDLEEGMTKPYFKTAISDDGWWFGEDTSFCQRARAAGFKLYIDTTVRVGHKGVYEYQIEDTIGAVPRHESLPLHFV
jgi:hypothetical protein